MKNHVKGHGKIGVSLQEVALARFTETIADLEKCREPAPGEAIHRVRKSGKKLRSLLRLVRRHVGRDAFQIEDACLRTLGREFGRLRDAQVQVEALDRLRRRYFHPRRPAILTQARRLLLSELGRWTKHFHRRGTINRSTAALQAARARCLAWEMKGLGWPAVLSALRKSYKQTRKAAIEAAADPAMKRLHEWRKRTKELGEQAVLLRRLSPPFMDELAHELEVLAEFLGEDHDLAVLRGKLVKWRAALDRPRALDALLEVLDLRRQELILTAIDLGERLFDDSAEAFAHTLDQHRQQHREAKKAAKKAAAVLAAR